MQNQNLFCTVPRYNMSKGLKQMRALSPEAQLKFYSLYFEQLNDLSILVLILKKVLYRMGSLGAVQNELLQSVLVDIESYEQDHFPVLKGFRQAEFTPLETAGVTSSLYRMVNLLGLQGVNCQATFHHRFLMFLKNPVMLATILLELFTILDSLPFMKSWRTAHLRAEVQKFIRQMKKELN